MGKIILQPGLYSTVLPWKYYVLLLLLPVPLFLTVYFPQGYFFKLKLLHIICNWQDDDDDGVVCNKTF